MQFGLQEVLKEPTYILDNSSLCIDLIFTSQADLLIESGAQPSLYSNCRHQIIYSKFDLHIFYLPPYLREVWHYKDGKTELIRHSIAMFDLEKAFSNTSVDEKVAIFNRTILNIFNNILFLMK